MQHIVEGSVFFVNRARCFGVAKVACFADFAYLTKLMANINGLIL